MRDYKDGKIYKIVCNNTGLTYYGSTCEKRLSRRLLWKKQTENKRIFKKIYWKKKTI